MGFRVHYRLICEGYLDYENAKTEEEARAQFEADPRSLFRNANTDDMKIIRIEEEGN